MASTSIPTHRHPGLPAEHVVGDGAAAEGRLESASPASADPSREPDGSGGAADEESRTGISRPRGQEPDHDLAALIGSAVRSLECVRGGSMWRLPSRSLPDVLAELGRLRHQLARVEAAAMVQVLERGLHSDRGMAPVDFLTSSGSEAAPAQPVSSAAQIVTLARAALQVQARHRRPAELEPEAGAATPAAAEAESESVGAGGWLDRAVLRDDRELERGPGLAEPQDVSAPAAGSVAGPADVLRGFAAGVVSASRAAAILRFHDRSVPISDPRALGEAMAVITAGAFDEPAGQHLPETTDPIPGGVAPTPDGAAPDEAAAGGEGPALPEGDRRSPHGRGRGWTDRELRVVLSTAGRTVRAAADLEREEERGRMGRWLHTLPCANGLTEYRITLEPHGASILDAAIGALSAPVPATDGTPDPRPAARRRADALVDLISRAVSSPDDAAPVAAKAQVMVTIGYADLLSSLRGAGRTGSGQVLSPGAVRQIGCDARIIPAVLGTQGQVLNMGRSTRLFTPAQRRALWARDGGCTFPGCTIPATWTDAHHIVHWARGGATDLTNGALLCARHHTHVHRHDLSATATDTGVTWHT